MNRWKKELRKHGYKLECDYPFLPCQPWKNCSVTLEGISARIVNDTAQPYIRYIIHTVVGNDIVGLDNNFQEIFRDFD